MIVVDSSAMVAIALQEIESDAFLLSMLHEDSVIGSPTLLETRIVSADRRIRDPLGRATLILDTTRTQVVAFDHEMVERATRAHMEFGKGRHSAKLNFGDCMAYALAKSLDAPLLYKGDDFTRTDIRPAVG